MRPTMLNACSAAATAAEAAYRIDAAPGLRVERATRVVALDAGAAEIVRPLPGQPWLGAHFLHHTGGTDTNIDTDTDLRLRTADGRIVRLGDELAEADFVMLIATNGDGAAAATVIGDACVPLGIMTAGLVLTADATGAAGQAAVTALRPHSRVLIVSPDQRDAAGLLSALGA